MPADGSMSKDSALGEAGMGAAAYFSLLDKMADDPEYSLLRLLHQ